MLNLLDNAAKWSPPGGYVELRLHQVDMGHAELIVSDRGPGIPADERGAGVRALLPFDIGPGNAGSGLGLAIVKQSRGQNGGKIRNDETVPGGQPRGRRSLCCSRTAIAAETYPDDSAQSEIDKSNGHNGFGGSFDGYQARFAHCGLSSLSVVTGKLSPLVRTCPGGHFFNRE